MSAPFNLPIISESTARLMDSSPHTPELQRLLGIFSDLITDLMNQEITPEDALEVWKANDSHTVIVDLLSAIITHFEVKFFENDAS